MDKLAIIVPCYNEEEILPKTVKTLLKTLDNLKNDNLISPESEIVFVDDGSRDKTWDLIEKFAHIYQDVKGIKLSRNYGHQNALLAGLFNTDANCYITIDADLQDDVSVIKDMVEKYKKGCDIVYGVRKERKTDSFFKKFTAETFYKFMKIMGVDLIYNHADYRLLSRRAVESLKQFNEVNVFLRGIVPLIGYKSDTVYYDRLERTAGESKYPLKKMLSFAWEGITSFSIAPLRFISFIGLVVFLVSFIMSGWVLWQKFNGHVIPGWASTVLPIYFIGGIQLLALGIIGEYTGKIYKETKGRPRYFIDKKLL